METKTDIEGIVLSHYKLFQDRIKYLRNKLGEDRMKAMNLFLPERLILPLWEELGAEYVNDCVQQRTTTITIPGSPHIQIKVEELFFFPGPVLESAFVNLYIDGETVGEEIHI